MKKIFYLAMVAVISAFALSCEESSKIKDDDLEFYTWNYTFEIVDAGGLSNDNLSQLKAIFAISESQLQFEATSRDAEKAFKSSITTLANTLKTEIAKMPHTSEIVIKIVCSSEIRSFTDTVRIP